MFGRRKPAIEMTTSEHLVKALTRFRDELRRAGAGKAPDPNELRALRELAEDLHRLASDTSLDPALRNAFTAAARTADRLIAPREGLILDWAAPGGG
jgi:hypothetical protein